MKKVIYYLMLLVLVVAIMNCCNRNEENVYMFSYFMGNGESGLHLAYSEDGIKWFALNHGESILEPTAGEYKLMRDPCIIKGADGKFHMVWTTGWRDRIIGYASSWDLFNWSEQRTIPVMEHEPEALNSWAPELFYDEENAEYLIFWATTIPGRHSFIEKDRDLNHRMYYTTTSDFKDFTKTEMFFNPNFSVIDCTILEKDNRFYMFLKNENPIPPEKNIRLTVSDNAAGPYSIEVSDPITGDYWAEGPTALIIGDSIYVYFDKYRERSYGAIRSKDLIKWDDVSDQVSFPQGTRHGTAFEVERSILENLKKKLGE